LLSAAVAALWRSWRAVPVSASEPVAASISDARR
jgi:hypothetical protein